MSIGGTRYNICLDMDNPSAPRLSVAARARYGLTEHGFGPLLALAAIVTDDVTGAALHYGIIPFRTHLALSVIAMAIVTWTCIQAIRRNLDVPPVRRAALLLLSLTFSQLLLGVGSYMNFLVPETLAWFPVAHAVMGIAVLGAAIALAVTVYRRLHPEDVELARGGVVIA
jgi:heme A synthase